MQLTNFQRYANLYRKWFFGSFCRSRRRNFFGGSLVIKRNTKKNIIWGWEVKHLTWIYEIKQSPRSRPKEDPVIVQIPSTFQTILKALLNFEATTVAIQVFFQMFRNINFLEYHQSVYQHKNPWVSKEKSLTKNCELHGCRWRDDVHKYWNVSFRPGYSKTSGPYFIIVNIPICIYSYSPDLIASVVKHYAFC